VPASRPRFARSGRVYYGKNYTAFRRQAEVLFDEMEFPVEFPLMGSLAVTSRFVVVPPKTTKRVSPRGDVDNYFKTLDVLNGLVWGDDDQLIWASMMKTFGDRPGIELEVMQIDGVPAARALPKLFLKGQSG
jgi:Holliday junction resolvase RusA-like endonuclease|tara:strand:+ start:880 stop:1275 length:396 start_codon:yes stop_codon:yes gene_type:complete